ERLKKDGRQPHFFGILYAAESQDPVPHGVLTRWIVGRTPTIGGLFTRIKMKLIRFPRVAEYGTYLDEFTCELAEVNDEMRTVRYTKPDDRRDDALHATNYAELLALRRVAFQRR